MSLPITSDMRVQMLTSLLIKIKIKLVTAEKLVNRPFSLLTNFRL